MSSRRHIMKESFFYDELYSAIKALKLREYSLVAPFIECGKLPIHENFPGADNEADVDTALIWNWNENGTGTRIKKKIRQGGQKKVRGWLHRLWIGGVGFLMAGLLLTASFTPAFAAEHTVRFNIPACMS
jgi:hypothetical protein